MCACSVSFQAFSLSFSIEEMFGSICQFCPVIFALGEMADVGRERENYFFKRLMSEVGESLSLFWFSHLLNRFICFS